MKKEIKDKWVKALRSGEYKQGNGCLRSKDEYCCLGVLCDLYIKETGRTTWKLNPGYLVEYEILDQEEVLPDEVKEWAGLDTNCGYIGTPPISISLTTLNDNGTTFERIADIIEEKF